MVLINCSKDCIHQREGLCALDSISSVTGKSVDGCCYYTPTHPEAGAADGGRVSGPEKKTPS